MLSRTALRDVNIAPVMMVRARALIIAGPLLPLRVLLALPIRARPAYARLASIGHAVRSPAAEIISLTIEAFASVIVVPISIDIPNHDPRAMEAKIV